MFALIVHVRLLTQEGTTQHGIIVVTLKSIGIEADRILQWSTTTSFFQSPAEAPIVRDEEGDIEEVQLSIVQGYFLWQTDTYGEFHFQGIVLQVGFSYPSL